MNVAETMRSLARRWYLVVPGLLLAVALGLMTWSVTKPAYERTASQILLPGSGTLPEDATNPFLYLGGLPAAADVLVRAVGSEEALRDLLEEYPDAEIEVLRDPSTSGPVLNINVTAGSDADAAAILDELVTRTIDELDVLQSEQAVPRRDRITVSTISVDQESTLQQRTRIVLSAGVAGGIILLSLVVASAVDGLLSRSRREGRGGRAQALDGDEDALANDGSLPEPDEPTAPPAVPDDEGEVEAVPHPSAEVEQAGDPAEKEEVSPVAGETPVGHERPGERDVADDESPGESNVADDEAPLPAPEESSSEKSAARPSKGRGRPSRSRSLPAPIGARHQ